MAVFMINICKYNGCGITFPRLADLIEHIEDVHIDYDPAVVEQKEASQPSCIPLSYVLKFFTEASRREIHNMTPAAEVRRRLLSAPKTPSVRSSTPTGSDMDDDEMLSASEDSNDSWTTVEEYSSEYILRYGVNRVASAGAAAGPAPQDKPFACPVPGCKKRYKNVNGIKYHSKNGHKKDGKVKKAYRCQCGKSYKTAQGLKSHSISQHIASGMGASGASVGQVAATAGPAGATGGLAVTTAASGPRVPGLVMTTAASGPRVPGLVVTTAASGPRVPGLVVTASPARPINAVDVDGNKLVRIYDSIKTKDLPTFTIPKHNLSGLSLVAGGLRHGLVASPDRRLERPRLTVQARPLTPHAAHAPHTMLVPHTSHAALAVHAPVAPLPYTNVGNEA